MNLATHHLYYILCDCHSKTGSLNSRLCHCRLTFERFKYMVHKLLGHTDAVVLDNKNVITVSVTERCLLHNPECNAPARRRIFNRVAQEIDKYLVELK